MGAFGLVIQMLFPADAALKGLSHPKEVVPYG